MDYSKLYYKCQRPDLVQLLKPGDNRILDVGCAEGLFGESLKKQGFANEIIGIEFCHNAAKAAKRRLDFVIYEDIELLIQREKKLSIGLFNYIICGDVLEHLKDPWLACSWLAKYLERDGLLIVSVPNIRHWSVLIPLLFHDEWEYQPHGIMDRTHLRFFTKKTAIRMIEDSGIQVLSCKGELRRKNDKLMNLLLLGMGKAFVTRQWTIVGKSFSS